MRRLFLLYILLSMVVLVGCDDYDSWTTSPSARLSMSEETVDFASVIAGQGSPTQTLMVRNRNSAGVRISRVELGQGADSPFRVNVDGQYLYGGVGEDFEVRKGDSIYVRIEVTVPEMDSDEAVHYEDVLSFTLESGVVQQVRLLADGVDVVVLKDVRIETDMTLSSARPYLIYDSLVVAEGVTLTVPAGVTLMFHDDAPLRVHGRIVAEGTLEKPVVFRCDRLDNMFYYLPYDRLPGRWMGIDLLEESVGNRFVQCDIHGGNYGVRCEAKELAEESVEPMLTMEDCTVHDVSGDALYLKNCMTRLSGTEIYNASGCCVRILGGDHRLVHCTVAQFFYSNDALYIANIDGNAYLHLRRCDFVNSVVTGNAEDVVMGELTETTDNPAQYLFSHCLLRTVVGEGNERFQDILLDDASDLVGKKHFMLVDMHDRLFDLMPVAESPIRGMADPSVAAQYPFDRRGRSRLSDGAPDTGALEGAGEE